MSSVFGGNDPVGTVHVVDPSPLNWLYVLYNCVEEMVRVDPDGHIEAAAMTKYRWEVPVGRRPHA